MAAEKIGNARCPLCHHKGARVSLSKSGLPVLTCNACHCQVFTRSEVSDTYVRGLLVPDAVPVAEPGGKPGTELPAVKLVEPTSAAPPAPPPARRPGLFSAWGATA